MKMFRVLSVLCIIGAIASPAFAAGAVQKRPSAPPANSVPLTTDELYRLYNNRSWIWKAGAGYFAVKQREFKAWSREESESYGVGHWFITEPGKLCFKAMWYAKDGSAPALTCFSHRKKGNIVYQKREPSGEWYAFKTTPAKASDEYRKIVPGDYVTAQYNRTRAKLARYR